MHIEMSGHLAVFSSCLLLCALVCATGATAQTATNPGQPALPGQIRASSYCCKSSSHTASQETGTGKARCQEAGTEVALFFETKFRRIS
jgi:hypothetical protein